MIATNTHQNIHLEEIEFEFLFKFFQKQTITFIYIYRVSQKKLELFDLM
jgi:hypothetical protein